jgi:hypothetical protein
LVTQWQQADRLATAADAAAFQVVPSKEPHRPVRIQIWDASQIVTWLDPDDQLTVEVFEVLELLLEVHIRNQLVAPSVHSAVANCRPNTVKFRAGVKWKAQFVEEIVRALRARKHGFEHYSLQSGCTAASAG